MECHFQSELRYKFRDVFILTLSPFSEHSIFGHSSWTPITLTTSSFESARICTYNTNGKSGNHQRHMSSLQFKNSYLAVRRFESVAKTRTTRGLVSSLSVLVTSMSFVKMVARQFTCSSRVKSGHRADTLPQSKVQYVTRNTIILKKACLTFAVQDCRHFPLNGKSMKYGPCLHTYIYIYI